MSNSILNEYRPKWLVNIEFPSGTRNVSADDLVVYPESITWDTGSAILWDDGTTIDWDD